MRISLSQQDKSDVSLSVVIPTYNCLEYLPKAVASVLDQKMANCELIIVDDGSTDGTLAWLEKLKACTSNVSIIYQKNKGVVNARNRAIGKARGEFIAFLDADDFRYPYTFERQLAHMQKNKNCVLSFTNYDHLTEDYAHIIDCFGYWKEFKQCSEFNNPLMFYPLQDPVNQLLSVNIIGTSTTMVRTSAIRSLGGFSQDMKSASDWEMWLRLAKIGGLAFSSESTTGYLMRAGSITSNRLERLSAISTIISANAKDTLSTGKAIRNAKSHLFEGYADYHRHQNNSLRAIICDVRSIGYAPQLRRVKHLCHDLKNLLTLNKLDRV